MARRAKPQAPSSFKLDYKRPWLYPKQESMAFTDARYSFCEGSTKAGKTVTLLTWLLEGCIMDGPGDISWWVAPVYSQAKMAFERMHTAVKGMFPIEYHKQLLAVSKTDLTIEIKGAGIMWFRSGEKPDNLFGEAVKRAVVDEASRLREEAWHALRSTVTQTRGPIRFIGNVKGRKNWFYKKCRQAEAGEPGYAYTKLTCWDAVEAGVLQESEIEEARRDLPPAIFSELYEAKPMGDDGNPFGVEAIQKQILPMSNRPIVCWGWDLAKRQDWTVGIGLDAGGNVAAFHRFQVPWGETIMRMKAADTGVPTLVDSTGVGDPIAEGFMRSHANWEGYSFNPRSKQNLMVGLAVAIQNQDVSFPEGPIVSELEAFEYEYRKSREGHETGLKYSAPSGMHDDCVCALALAVRCRETKTYTAMDGGGGWSLSTIGYGQSNATLSLAEAFPSLEDRSP